MSEYLNAEERAVLTKARDIIGRVVSLHLIAEALDDGKDGPYDKVKYYEAHLTLNKADAAIAQDRAPHYGFHVSVITGDDVLDGLELKHQKPYAYCTRRDKDPRYLENLLIALTVDLGYRGVKPIRRKIEAIVLDERLTNIPTG
jgi:hypothetical protein